MLALSWRHSVFPIYPYSATPMAPSITTILLSPWFCLFQNAISNLILPSLFKLVSFHFKSCISGSFMLFPISIAHLFLFLNGISLPGCIIYLPMGGYCSYFQLFFNCEWRYCKHLCASFCVGVSFQHSYVNLSECNFWICLVLQGSVKLFYSGHTSWHLYQNESCS